MSSLTATTNRRSKWGSIHEAGDYLGVSVDTIRRMIARGEIEARRFGSRTLRVNLLTLDEGGRLLGSYRGGAE